MIDFRLFNKDAADKVGTKNVKMGNESELGSFGFSKLFARHFNNPSFCTTVGAIVLTCCFSAINAPSSYAQDPPQPPSDATAGTNGINATKTITGDADVVSGWGVDGTTNGTNGADAPGWAGGAYGGQVGTDATAAEDGVTGGRAGKGGDAGTLTLNVTDTADFSFYTILGVTGGAGGDGGTGGRGQTSGDGISGYAPDQWSRLNGGNGGNGGAGAEGVSGGKGGTLTFNHSDGTVSFASNTIFGGTGGTGGKGGTGGLGTEGGIGMNGYGSFHNGSGDMAGGDGGNGGDGGDGGDGGNGGTGGDGGDAVFSLTGGTITFDNATFGGKGGNGGNGGASGTGGIAGRAGAGLPAQPNYPVAGDNGIPGQAGENGAQGNGGSGGKGGNGTITIDGGTAIFTGINTIGGNGGTAGAGAVAGTAGTNGNGSLTLADGTLQLDGNINFQGTGSKFNFNGGTLTYGDDQTIDLNGGTMTFAGDTTLNQSTTGKVLTIANATIDSQDSNKITVYVVDSGNFLKVDADTSDLTQASFAFDNTKYRAGTTFTENGGVWRMELGGEALTSTWQPGAQATREWKTGVGFGGDNWGAGVDFMGGDTAIFTSAGQGDVELVDAVLAKEANIESGTYVFKGTGYLAEGSTLNVSGSGTNLTLENANRHDNTNITDGAIVTAMRTDSLGTGTVANEGTLNISNTADGELNNVLAGTGTINIDGGSKVILTKNNTATGDLNVTNGSVQIGNGGTAGNYAGNIVSDANVTFNRTDDWAFAGTLSGNGTLVNEAGDVTLNKANTHAGGVEIQGGSVTLGTDGESALGPGNAIVTAGTLNVNGHNVDKAINLNGGALENSSGSSTVSNVTLGANAEIGGTGNLTVSNAMTGNYSVTKTGTGKATFTGANTYTGGTTVEAGELELGTGGSVDGNIVLDAANAGLIVNNTDITMTNVISGAGYVEISQDATLSGANTYSGGTSVAEGVKLTGVIGNGALALGSGSEYELGENQTITTLTDAATSQVTLGANNLIISGNSMLNGAISGSGNVTLGGETTINGNITVGDVNLNGITTIAGSIVGTNVNVNANTTIAEGKQMTVSGTTTVAVGKTLAVTAAKTAEEAAIQGSGTSATLIIASGGKLETSFSEDREFYDMQGGDTATAYVANGLVTFTADAADVITTDSRFFEVVGIIRFDGGVLSYEVERRLGADLYPDLSPELFPILDEYGAGGALNEYVEYLIKTNNGLSDEQVASALQSSFDIVNQTAPMTMLNQTRMGIGNAIYTRSQITPSNSGSRYNNQYLGQSACDPVCGYNGSVKREAWVAPIYGNSKGFRLNSGNFRYAHVNDQYAMAFGIDTVQGGTRLGVMGLGGWGKARSSGNLNTTWNDSTFGGAYVYANTRRGNTDFLVTAGYLGMDNELSQSAYGGNITSDMTSGMASVSAMITQTYRMGGLYVAPVFGVEYGYYHQGSADSVWNNATVLRNDKAHANVVVLPVGVNLSTETRLANGAMLTPEFRARYIGNVGDVVTSYNVSLPGSTPTALMATKMADRHAGDIGLGFGLTRGVTTLRFDYGYMFSQHYQDQYASAMARWQF